MVFFNHVLYANIGIPKSQISGSFTVFLKDYVKKIIEYYVQMDHEALLGIDIPDVPIKEDKNIIQYILLITENPETSRLIHDKIYGMIHHFARFVTSRGEKCSFEDFSFLKPSKEIDAIDFEIYVGKILKRNASAGEAVTLEDFYA